MTRKTSKQRRLLVERVREFVTGRGNDGLTRHEREKLAQEYRRRAVRPLSSEESQAVAQWREARRRDASQRASQLA